MARTPTGLQYRSLRAACHCVLGDVRACLAEFEQQVQPLLVETEVLRASVSEQNRVIRDLNAAIRQLRHEAAA